MCNNTTGGVFRNIETGNSFHIHLDCKTWDCDPCADQHLKPKWCDHVETVFEAQKRVYRLTIDRSQWRAVYAKLNRRGAEYVRIRLRHNRRAVYTDKPIDGAKCISPEAARDTACREINELRGGRRPISTSRGWKMPRKSAKKHERLCKGHVPKSVAKQVADEFNARTRERVFAGVSEPALLIETRELDAETLDMFKARLGYLADTAKFRCRPRDSYANEPDRAEKTNSHAVSAPSVPLAQSSA